MLHVQYIAVLYIISHVLQCNTLRGWIKVHCRIISRYYLGTRAISRYCSGNIFPLTYTLICRLLHQKLPIQYIVKLVTFTCGIEFYNLTITENVTILIVTDIYEMEPTSGEFLNTHLKNSIL